MTQVIYVGPSKGGVEIAETGQFAAPGEPIEVSTELAKRLLEQDIWEKPKSSSAKADD